MRISDWSSDVCSSDLHAVLPTKLPLEEFYRELVMTQRVLNMKHLGWRGLRGAAANAARLALRGQTNFLRMLWKFNGVYNADPQIGRAACRERVGPYVLNQVVAVYLKKKHKKTQKNK